MLKDYDLQDNPPGQNLGGEFAKIQSERIESDVRLAISFHYSDSITICVMK